MYLVVDFDDRLPKNQERLDLYQIHGSDFMLKDAHVSSCACAELRLFIDQ